jgi:hypothetical protein
MRRYWRVPLVLLLLAGGLGLLKAWGENAAMVEPIPLPTPIPGPGIPIGNAPVQAVVAAMKGVTSYHFVMMTGARPPADGDVIPPNKLFTTRRFVEAGRTSEQKEIRVNDQWWTAMGWVWGRTVWGRTWMFNFGGGKVRDYPLDLVLIDTVPNGEDLGEELIAGVATRHLRYSGLLEGVPGPADIWVDKSTNYLVQIKFTNNSGPVLIRCSRFNDPSIKIEPPE